MDREQIISCLGTILTKNAIDGHFNFNAGVAVSQLEFYDIAVYRFLTCALIQRDDAEAWSNAIACSLNSKHDILTMPIMEAAYFHLNEDCIPWLLGKVPNSPTTTDVDFFDRWRTCIYEFVKMQNGKNLDKTLTVRTHNGNKGTKFFVEKQ